MMKSAVVFVNLSESQLVDLIRVKVFRLCSTEQLEYSTNLTFSGFSVCNKKEEEKNERTQKERKKKDRTIKPYSLSRPSFTM